MDMRIPPLSVTTDSTIESNPLKSIILVRRLAVMIRTTQGPEASVMRTWRCAAAGVS